MTELEYLPVQKQLEKKKKKKATGETSVPNSPEGHKSWLLCSSWAENMQQGLKPGLSFCLCTSSELLRSWAKAQHLHLWQADLLSKVSDFRLDVTAF